MLRKKTNSCCSSSCCCSEEKKPNSDIPLGVSFIALSVTALIVAVVIIYVTGK